MNRTEKPETTVFVGYKACGCFGEMIVKRKGLLNDIRASKRWHERRKLRWEFLPLEEARALVGECPSCRQWRVRD